MAQNFIRETYRQNADEYVARIENIEFLLASSCKIASVKSAVASTVCGRFPRIFHVHTYIPDVTREPDKGCITEHIGTRSNNQKHLPAQMHSHAYLAPGSQEVGRTDPAQQQAANAPSRE